MDNELDESNSRCDVLNLPLKQTITRLKNKKNNLIKIRLFFLSSLIYIFDVGVKSIKSRIRYHTGEYL